MVTEFKKRSELVFRNYAKWCKKHEEELKEMAKEELTDEEIEARLNDMK